MPLDPRLLAAIAQSYDTARSLRAQYQPTATPPQEEPEGFFEKYIQDPFRIALEAPRAATGYIAGRLDPEGYEQAFAKNIQEMAPKEDLAGTLTSAPSAGQLALEAIAPEEPTTGVGKGIRGTAELAGEILTDPLTLVPGANLARAGKAARLATRAAQAGRGGRATKLGTTALTTAMAAPAPAAVAYGKDIYEGTVGGGQQALEAYQRGDMEGAKAGAVQAALTGSLGGLLGLGLGSEIKSIRKAKQVIARQADPPVGTPKVVAEAQETAQEAQQAAARDIPEQPLEISTDIPPDAQDAVITPPEAPIAPVPRVDPTQPVEAPKPLETVAEIGLETPSEGVPEVSPRVEPEITPEALEAPTPEVRSEVTPEVQEVVPPETPQPKPDEPPTFATRQHPDLPEGYQVVQRNNTWGVLDPEGNLKGASPDSPESAIAKFQESQGRIAESERVKTEAAALRGEQPKPDKSIDNALLEAYQADLPARGGLRSMPIPDTQKRLLEQGYSTEDINKALVRLQQEGKVGLAVHDRAGEVPDAVRAALPKAAVGTTGKDLGAYYWTPVKGKFEPPAFSTKETPKVLDTLKKEIKQEGELLYLPTLRSKLQDQGLSPEDVDNALLTLERQGDIQLQDHPTPSQLDPSEASKMLVRTPREVLQGYGEKGQESIALKEKLGDTTLDEPKYYMAVGLRRKTDKPAFSAKEASEAVAPKPSLKLLDKQFPGLKWSKSGDDYRTILKNGKGLVVRQGHIEIHTGQGLKNFMAATGRKPSPTEVAEGVTEVLGNDVVITLSRYASPTTLTHEQFHAAMRTALDEGSINKIYKYFSRGDTSSGWQRRAEESAAKMYESGKWAEPIKKPFESIRRVFRKISNAIFGSKSADEWAQIQDIFKRVPESFQEPAGGTLAAKQTGPPTKPIKPIPTTRDSKKIVEAAEKEAPISKEDVDKAKPGGKPDVWINTRLEGVEGVPDWVREKVVKLAKAQQPHLDRATKMNMSPEALDGLMMKQYDAITADQIREKLSGGQWDIEDFRAFGTIHKALQNDFYVKKSRANASPTNQNLADEAIESSLILEAVGGLIGNKKTEIARILRSLAVARTMDPSLPMVKRLLKVLEEQGVGQKRLDDIEQLYHEEGIDAFGVAFAAARKPGFWQKVGEWRIGSMLMGLVTHVVNTASNSLQQGIRLTEEGLFAPAASRLIQRGSKAVPEAVQKQLKTEGIEPLATQRREFGEMGAAWAGWNKAVRDKNGIWKQFLQDLTDIARARDLSPRSRINPLEIRSTKAMEMDPAIGGTTGQIIRSGGKLLESADGVMKGLSASREIYQQVYRRLRKIGHTDTKAKQLMGKEIKEVLDFRDNLAKLVEDPEFKWNPQAIPSQRADAWKMKILQAADMAAKEDTFQRPLEGIWRSVQLMVNSHPALKALLVPFVRTPINIYRESLVRVPGVGMYGYFKNRKAKAQAVRDIQYYLDKLKEGRQKADSTAISEAQRSLKRLTETFEKSDKEMIDVVAKQATGAIVSIAALTTALELSDPDGAMEITGGGPKDPRRWSQKYATGWRPYSIRVGDNYYDYSRLEPLSGLIGAFADAAESYKSGEVKTGKEMAQKGIISFNENFLNKTFMMGLEGLFAALHQPERELDQYVRSFTQSFMPNIIRAAARGVDPVMRDTGSPFDGIEEFQPYGLAKTVAATIPGASMLLEARKDTLGRERRRDYSFAPWQIGKRKSEKADELLREFDKVGYVPTVRKTIQDRQTAESVRLTRQERDTLWEIRRATMEDLANRMLTDPTYNRLPTDNLKKQYISNLISRRERRFKRQIYDRARQRARADQG